MNRDTHQPEDKSNEIDQIIHCFNKQKQAVVNNPVWDSKRRAGYLNALRKAILAAKEDLIQAMSEDFGHRSEHDTIIADILPTVRTLRYCEKNVKRWMRPKRRHPGFMFMPATVKVYYQPLGVVGIIVPWNFPMFLALGPLAFALAAGNRVMLKMSEFTPVFNVALERLLNDVFTENEVILVQGEIEVSTAFSRLPFDHILFTGSTAVGKHVMRAASENLTPVTLELGGKSPVLIDRTIPMKTAVERMIYGKSLNAGQICVAPDYVLLPQDRVDEFVTTYQTAFTKRYGRVGDNPDYSSIINDTHYDRLNQWLRDAEEKGARIIGLDPRERGGGNADRKLATHLVLNVTRDMTIMREEIFGPILPLVTYQDYEEMIDYVNQGPHPLALYLMSFDPGLQNKIIERTRSGGVALNETTLQVAIEDAPFGGVGPSGMGQYHGPEGFLTFSKAKTVFKKGRFLNTAIVAHPPYGGFLQRLFLRVFLR